VSVARDDIDLARERHVSFFGPVIGVSEPTLRDKILFSIRCAPRNRRSARAMAPNTPARWLGPRDRALPASRLPPRKSRPPG
jgi:hypothetical protein